MCGFIGEFSKSLSTNQGFFKLLNKSRNRGPDQSKTWTDNIHCQLGFNRLSILDTSENGNQPILSPSGRYALVFNGEIYNYKNLQQQYGISNHKLRSNSDSEIIAQLIDIVPIETMAGQLNGMFAIAIYDKEQKTLTLIRDFAGIKPLFYGISEETLFFASQFDQIFQNPKFRNKLQVDSAGLYNYTALGYMPAPGTVFKQIQQCLPGELIQFDTKLAKINSFFQVLHPKAWEKSLPDGVSVLDEMDAIFNHVVHDQLVSDVPVGVFLSGGIDSPLISAYAKKLKSDITAYTIGLDSPEMDESTQASHYAKALGIKHNISRFTENDLLRELEHHFDAYPEPFGDYSSLPTHLITAIAKRENTVMLSGDGGDELFWGYPRFLNTVNHAPWFKYPLPLRKVASGALRRTLGKQISYAVSSSNNIEDWVLNQQCHNKPVELLKMLPDLAFSKEIKLIYTSPISLHDKTAVLQYLRWNEFYGHMQRVLTKVDRSSMGNSLEVRVPFLDQRIIEFAWRISPGLGIQHQEPKFLLKALLQRKIGQTKVYKPKKGFGVPIREWLRGPLKEDVLQHLLDYPLFGQGYWNRTAVEEKIKRFMENNQGNEWGIWILYAMQKWAKKSELI